MKKRLIIFVLLIQMVLALTACQKEDRNVTENSVEDTETEIEFVVSTSEILNDDFRGFGIEWDPHAESRVPDSDWELLTKRVSFLSPGIVRCMVLARWYVVSVEDGEPRLNFDNYEMRQAMKVLDYCQSNDIPVVWGDWGPPQTWVYPLMMLRGLRRWPAV